MNRRLAAWLYYMVCIAITAVVVFPVAWVLFCSLRPAAESAKPPSWIPSTLSLENYEALTGIGAGLWRYAGNSLAVATGSALAVAALATLAGYGFSRFRFVGRGVVFVAMLAAMMVPFQAVLTPLFIVLRNVGLHNSLLGLTLVYTTFHLPFGLFVMSAAIAGVPRALDEAAVMDGARPLTLLLRVILPVVAPSVVTVVLINFVASWNEFLAALILMTDQGHYTMPVMLVTVTFGYMGTVDWGSLQAGTVLTMLPVLVLTLAFQRYYVQGLVAGATKG